MRPDEGLRGDTGTMAGQPVLEFAGLLRQLRAEAGLTQEELAEAAGLSPRSVSDLERGIMGRPAFSGQRIWSYFMLHAADSRTRRELLAESGTRVLNGGESDYTGARRTVQCLPVLSLPSGTRYGGPARLSPRH